MSELRFCAVSNPARSVSEIRNGQDLWQWSRLEIRLNSFRQSSIRQKQFITIILPTPLYIRYLQRKKIEGLFATKSFDSKVYLDHHLFKEGLNWWLINLSLNNGRSRVTKKPELVIQSDASSWGAYFQKASTYGSWSREEEESLHINILELIAAKF